MANITVNGSFLDHRQKVLHPMTFFYSPSRHQKGTFGKHKKCILIGKQLWPTLCFKIYSLHPPKPHPSGEQPLHCFQFKMKR